MAGLKVPQVALDKASKFLDSMQSDAGAKYGETSPQRICDRSTAAGLYARQLLGWKRDNPVLAQGVKHLTTVGVAKNDVVFNYYAGRFLQNMNGYEWDAWNRHMRKHLCECAGEGGRRGGQLVEPRRRSCGLGRPAVPNRGQLPGIGGLLRMAAALPGGRKYASVRSGSTRHGSAKTQTPPAALGRRGRSVRRVPHA